MRRPRPRPRGLYLAPRVAPRTNALRAAQQIHQKPLANYKHTQTLGYMKERTFSILKPDAVRRNLTGKINSILEEAGFVIVAQKMIHMSKEKAQGFYIVHKDRPFYDELTTYMSSGPVVVQVLEKENAVEDYRKIMGATDPKKAEPNTIRAKFALSVGENSIHGSDSLENAGIEINYFFTKDEICER